MGLLIMENNLALHNQIELSPKTIVLDKFKMLVFILVIGLISAGVLVTLDYYTKPLVERNIELRLKESILLALDLNYSKDNVEKVFKENITVINRGDLTFYQTTEGEIAVEFTGNALWGPVAGIIALNSDMKTLKGLSVIEQRETPGLGGRIAERQFLEQFRGLNTDPQIIILPASQQAVNENEVDGISGATLTSKALEKLLNNTIDEIKKQLGVGRNG